MYVAVTTDTFFGSMATTALFTMMMDQCRPGNAGTDYTLQASVIVVAVTLVSSVSGISAEALGYVGHFTLTAVLAAVGLVGVYALLGKRPERLVSCSGGKSAS